MNKWNHSTARTQPATTSSQVAMLLCEYQKTVVRRYGARMTVVWRVLLTDHIGDDISSLLIMSYWALVRRMNYEQ